jgi:hypothetical protein
MEFGARELFWLGVFLLSFGLFIKVKNLKTKEEDNKKNG